MKVLHLAAADLWAGAETMLYNLVRAQQRIRELEVAVVLFNEGRLADMLREAGVEIVVHPESQLNVLQLTYACASFIKTFRPDVVHTHKFKEDVVGAAATMLTGGGVCVRTVHGLDEAFGTTAGVRLRLGLSRAVHAAIVRHRFAMTFAVSRSLEENLKRSQKSDRVSYIANGIDLVETPDPDLPSREVLPLRIGFAGRLVPVKRVDIFLEMAACLTLERPGSFDFYVYGDGPEGDALRRLARHLGIEHCVHFCGFTPSLSHRLRELDLLYLTSDSEGLPMVVLEAMALGVPVVAHAVGELPEVLDHGRCGTLVYEHNAGKYAEAAIARTQRRQEFLVRARNAQLRAVEKYSADASARGYLEGYERCLRH